MQPSPHRATRLAPPALADGWLRAGLYGAHTLPGPDGCGPGAVRATAGSLPGYWDRLLLTSLQAGVLAGALCRGVWPRLAAARALAVAVTVFCLVALVYGASPATCGPLVAACCHATIYGSLLWLFGRSLLPGREAVATRLARRFHAPLTARRLRYTRNLTGAWAGWFACQCAVSVPIALWPDARFAWLARADLPMAALFMAGELALRGWLFRGEPHASAADMIKAFRSGFPAAGGGARPR